VIALVSRYFVPAWLSRDNYQLGERAEAEREEVLRIDRDRHRRGIPGGSVCLYIVAPDGAVTASLPVQQAHKTENMLPFLERIVAQEKLRPRSPETARALAAPPRPPARPKTEGGLVLHLYTRVEVKESNRGVSQDWVELTTAEWASLVPAGKAGPQDVPREVAEKLYRHMYPPGPVWDAKNCEVLRARLTATPLPPAGGEQRFRLNGSLELIFPAKQKPADGRVTAELAGEVSYDPARRVITGLALASEEAKHVWYWKGKPQPVTMQIGVEVEH
jgi:hypothetical protein